MINKLDGLTILRFTHALKSGAGMEQYLDDLDRALLTRNKVEVIRMHLEGELKGEKKITEKIGQGILVKIFLDTEVRIMHEYGDKQKINQSKLSFLKRIFRVWIVYNPFLYHVFFQEFIRKQYPRPMAFEYKNAKEEVKKIFQEYKVDLLVMHHIGGIDSTEIMEEAEKRKVVLLMFQSGSN